MSKTIYYIKIELPKEVEADEKFADGLKESLNEFFEGDFIVKVVSSTTNQ